MSRFFLFLCKGRENLILGPTRTIMKHPGRSIFHLLLLYLLFVLQTNGQGLVINEYMADNETILQDLEGDFTNDNLIIYGDLQVEGTIYEVSDFNKKTNINPFTNSLDKVMALNGVSFEWIQKDESKGITDGPDQSIGVIAQEVELVLPSLVSEKRNGNKAVNYSGLIPVLLEAIKEQQNQIESLELRIAELEQ